MSFRLFFIAFMYIGSTTLVFGQNSLGSIQPNTNLALPSSYNFQEYVFAEPDDQGDCTGRTNNTARIEEVFVAQTHRHAIGHPLHFVIGHRPALLQVAVMGSGQAPDVAVEGFLDGESLGTLCLKGPANLNSSINLDVANFEDYFSVTLPKSWVKFGLELEISTDNSTREISAEALNVGPYTELNLVMVNMDFLDYNDEPHYAPIFDDFLEEVASALPASVVRFGTFPHTLPFPELVASNDEETLVLLNRVDDIWENDIPDEGYINGVASTFLSNLQASTGDYLSTIYFGNTLNLAPGGWGGGKSFVSPDFTDIFIHELGHALSLPHWGEAYDIPNPEPDSYLYPYGGEVGEASGRGEAWNFIQDSYRFESPICEEAGRDGFGKERSDCMQREFPCLGQRGEELAPWDGFGDFSAIAMHRYLIGADIEIGQVPYRGGLADYQLEFQEGFPRMSLEGEQRTYTREGFTPDDYLPENDQKLPGEEKIEQDVYLVYGSAHLTQEQANIVYQPIKYKGTLPAIIDPTDASTFERLKTIDREIFPIFYDEKDITLKLTYADGSVLHALNPFHSYDREAFDDDYGLWRGDVCYFSLVVPGDKELCKVELYNRPFYIGEEDEDFEGNINYAPYNITAANFMEDAKLQAVYDCGLLINTEETFEQTRISAYPNPFDSDFVFEITQFEQHQLSIFSTTGQVVFQSTLQASSTTIQMENLPSGIYFAVLRDANGAIVGSEKLMKQ